MYLTARSYLLAGFTATSIVAAISAAPNTSAHLPAVQTAQVRLSAADSEIASKMRTFRNAEVRTVSSLVDRTATVVGNLAAHSRAAATEGQAVTGAKMPTVSATGVDTSTPAASTNVRQPDASLHVGAAASAASFDPSTLAPLIGDLAAFNFDLLGTPFALVTALDVGGQVAIADLSRGMVQNLLRDVTFSLEFNLSTPLTRLTADLRAATAEVNKIADSMHPPSDTASGATDTPQSAAGPAAPGEPTASNLNRTSANRTPIGSLAPSAIGPLIGNTAILGLEVGIVPLEAVTSLTNALSGAAMDLGAGQFEEAKAFAASQLRGDFLRVESNIADDLKAIGANVAQLTGTSRPAGQDAKAVRADRYERAPRHHQEHPLGASRPTGDQCSKTLSSEQVDGDGGVIRQGPYSLRTHAFNRLAADTRVDPTGRRNQRHHEAGRQGSSAAGWPQTPHDDNIKGSLERARSRRQAQKEVASPSRVSGRPCRCA